MPDIKSIQRMGQFLRINYTDGSGELALYNGQSSWQVKQHESNKPAGGSGGATAGGVYITAEMIYAAVDYAGSPRSAMKNSAEEIADALNTAIRECAPGDFMSKESRACLVGECAQETDWFKTYEEYSHASGDYPYWGRGLIQLTWSDNYRTFTTWIRGFKADCPDFVQNYNTLNELPYAAYAAVYYFTDKYWEGNNLCWWADNNPHGSYRWGHISGAINTGSPYGVGYAFDLRAGAIDAVLAVTPDVNAGGSADAAVQWIMSHLNRFYYSQDAWTRNNMIASGGGDCSSTVITAYEDSGVAGREVLGGTASAIGYTGTLGRAGNFVCNNAAANESQMIPGDLILISWGGGGWPWDHVEMYIGNGQVCGHGGPGNGPTVKSLGPNSVGYSNEVRRYV